ncbi:MAG: MFS transporter, partial [Deltaproteobacteria bacterium]|nr:MFS transporter [Deltaproteobacteria bacterium]
MTTVADLETHKKHSWLVQYFLDFKVLKDNPMAFWIVQLINLLDSIAYFAMLGVVTLFLTQTIGQDKVTTGYIVTVFTTLITVSLFVAGFVTDAFGIKKSLLLAQGVHLAARVVIAACGLLTDLPARGWIVAVALVLSAPGAAMTQTVFQAANKRLSSRKSRSASFNIWYLIMNIGAMLGGLSIDVVRQDLKVSLSWIFVMGAITAGLNVLATIVAVRHTEQVRGEGEEEEVPAEHDKPKGGFGMLKDLVRDTAFWRFIVLMVAVLGVRAVFAYMYLLMPQYWVEVIEQTGSAKTDKGLMQAINPILIVGGLIL